MDGALRQGCRARLPVSCAGAACLRPMLPEARVVQGRGAAMVQQGDQPAGRAGSAALFDVLALEGRVKVVDVGAAPGGRPSWAGMMRDGRVDLVAIEPDAGQAERLRRHFGARATVLEHVIGDGSPGLFRETAHGFTASLLEPDNTLAAAFNNLAPLSRVVNRRPVTTHRLDDLAEVEGADFLKIDAQGGEAAILAGAPRTLARALAVEIEVMFLPLYSGQALFADLDIALRAAGFVFHTFLQAGRRTFAPMRIGDDPDKGLNQVLWADAVYVRDWMALDALGTDHLRRYAALMHGLYGSFDLALRIAHEIDRRTGSDTARAYETLLQTGAVDPAHGMSHHRPAGG